MATSLQERVGEIYRGQLAGVENVASRSSKEIFPSISRPGFYSLPAGFVPGFRKASAVAAVKILPEPEPSLARPLPTLSSRSTDLHIYRSEVSLRFHLSREIGEYSQQRDTSLVSSAGCD